MSNLTKQQIIDRIGYGLIIYIVLQLIAVILSVYLIKQQFNDLHEQIDILNNLIKEISIQWK